MSRVRADTIPIEVKHPDRRHNGSVEWGVTTLP